MDNFHIKVVSEGRTDFNAALDIATKRAPGGKATHYHISVVNKRGTDLLEGPVARLTFYWTKPSDGSVLALPYAMGPKELAEFAWGWLQQADHGREPDHDGSNRRGFVVLN